MSRRMVGIVALLALGLAAVAAASCLGGGAARVPLAGLAAPHALSAASVEAAASPPAPADPSPTAGLQAAPTRPPVTLTRPRATATPTATASPPPTATASPAPTSTASPPPTATASPAPTETASPPATASPLPTATATPDGPPPEPVPTAVRVNPPDYAPDGRPAVYLTFDDGPYDKATPQILEILARFDAHATFFMLGASVERFPDLARSVAQAGHAVQNHSYHHQGLDSLDHDHYVADLQAAQLALQEVSGALPFCVRPPRGASDTATREAIGEQGLQMALWDVDPQDWRRPGADVIAQRVLDGVRPGAIVVLHDGGGDRSETVTALEAILTELSARGYAFLALTPG